jgi:hypothetical protein
MRISGAEGYYSARVATACALVQFEETRDLYQSGGEWPAGNKLQDADLNANTRQDKGTDFDA